MNPRRDEPCSDSHNNPNRPDSQRGNPPIENSQQTLFTNNRRERRDKQRKETKAAILILCLNINGFSCAGSGDSISDSKWSHINQLLWTLKTGILVVSEAHLTERRRDELENLFARRMKICFTADPENLTSKGGVAIVVNKQLTLWHNIETRIIVPGHAMLLKTKWHGDKDIIILGIYAPNVTASTASESADFFRTLHSFFSELPSWKPDYMGGDMNFVEDSIDRLPMRTDNIEVRIAFDELKELLRLQDGWRNTFSDRREYTFSCTKSFPIEGSLERVTKVFQSRIDRIYVTERLMETARQWKIQPIGITGVDHDMVSVQIAHEDAPLQGKGRWACPNGVLKDAQFKDTIKELGIRAQEGIRAVKQAGRTPTENAQRIYEKLITEAMHQARLRERTIKTRARQRESDLNRAISRLTNENSLDDLQCSERLANLKKELKNIKKEEHNNARRFMAAKDHLKGETVSKYYFQTNKEAKPRDAIQALEIPLPERAPGQEDTVPEQEPAPRGGENLGNPQPHYEKYSPKMAEMMRDYHGNTLQNDGLDIEEDTRDRAMREVLESNITVSPTEENKESLKIKTSRDEVLKPLRLSKNDSAPGINGATNKFYKVFNDCFTEDERKGLPSFDIVGILTEVFNDIEEYGMDTSTRFTEGWMCPIYKKNDKNKMSNYQPITLLNSEYKLFTKALSIKL
ncbi:hypothetical protein EDD85DRAFT_774723, partial [Armillaria nabsnona]